MVNTEYVPVPAIDPLIPRRKPGNAAIRIQRGAFSLKRNMIQPDAAVRLRNRRQLTVVFKQRKLIHGLRIGIIRSRTVRQIHPKDTIRLRTVHRMIKAMDGLNHGRTLKMPRRFGKGAIRSQKRAQDKKYNAFFHGVETSHIAAFIIHYNRHG